LVVPGLAEAEMWREMLGEEGIVALIQPNDASMFLGPNSFCHVLVASKDAAHAAELVDAWSAEAETDEKEPLAD
jgi:hypothetical protein